MRVVADSDRETDGGWIPDGEPRPPDQRTEVPVRI